MKGEIVKWEPDGTAVVRLPGEPVVFDEIGLVPSAPLPSVFDEMRKLGFLSGAPWPLTFPLDS